jgi:hypothetical protein
MLRNWHRRKAGRLSAIAEDRRKYLEEILERAAHHEHRAKHWDLIANRRRN